MIIKEACIMVTKNSRYCSPFGSTTKMGGGTIQRTVGTVTATARAEALKQGWTMLREKRIVENEGWSWVVPTSSD